jgi:flagellar hook-length control protein FliK
LPDTTANALLQAAGASQPLRSSEAMLKLPNGEATQWRQPLVQARGERRELMRNQGSDTAVIRLDPPMMGRIEIAIRYEVGGALKVNLSATHNEVLRQLQGIGENLRAELSQRQFGDVAVHVSSSASSRFAQGDSEGQQRQRQQQSQEPGRALAEAETGRESGAYQAAQDQE